MKKRPLKTAAYCGIVLLIIAIISNIITEITGYYKIENVFLDSIFVLVGWIDLLLMMFFIYGFVILGKKYKKKLLTVMSWIMISIIIITLAFSILGSLMNLIPTAAASSPDISQNIKSQISQMFAENPGLTQNSNLNALQNLTPEQEKLIATAFIIAWIIISIILGTLSILFGIGVLSLEEIKYSRATGILNIIAGATYIIFIGFIIELAAFVMGVILLFNAYKKLER
ncbi:MAG: hypothetical protein AABX54_02020 [Nanoarchaeota archaeon]